MTARTLDQITATTSVFTPYQAECPRAPRLDLSIDIPLEVRELASQRLRSYTGGERRRLRVLDALRAVKTAAVFVLGQRSVGEESFLIQLLLWSEVLGTGGPAGLGGAGRATARAVWAQGLGSERHYAGDGQVWNEAIEQAARIAWSMDSEVNAEGDFYNPDLFPAFSGLDREGEMISYWLEPLDLGDIARLRQVLGDRHARSLALRLTLAAAGHGQEEWSQVCPQWAQTYWLTEEEGHLRFLYPGLYLQMEGNVQRWARVISELWDGSPAEEGTAHM